MGKKAALVSLLAVLGSALVIAGCGSSSGDTNSGSAESTSGETVPPEGESSGSTDAALGEAKKFVADHSSLEGLDWPEPPEEPYEAGSGQLGVVVCSTAGTGCLEIGRQVRAAASAAGWSPSELADGKFTPSVQAGLIQKFVQEGVDGIVLVGIDPTIVRAAVDQATKAKIPMACLACTSVPGFPGFGGPFPMVTVPGKTTGEYLATYLIAETDGKGSFLQFVDDAFPITRERGETVKRVIEEKCPNCEYQEQKIATEELLKPGPPYFTAALASNPSLEWAFVASDTYDIPMAKTAEQQGRDVKIAGIDAEVAFVELIADGGPAQATVYTPNNYIAWAGVDEVIRQARGLEAWDASEMPTAIIHTPEVVEEVLSAAPQYYSPPDFDYEALFKRIWNG